MCELLRKSTAKAQYAETHVAGVCFSSWFQLTSVQFVQWLLRGMYEVCGNFKSASSVKSASHSVFTDVHEHNFMRWHQAGGSYGVGEKPDELPWRRTLGEPQLRQPSSSSTGPRPPPECCEQIRRRVRETQILYKRGPHTLLLTDMQGGGAGGGGGEHTHTHTQLGFSSGASAKVHRYTSNQ